MKHVQVLYFFGNMKHEYITVNIIAVVCLQDNIPGELVELLQDSSNPFVASLFGDTELEQPGKKKKTVLAKFKVCGTQTYDPLYGSI